MDLVQTRNKLLNSFAVCSYCRLITEVLPPALGVRMGEKAFSVALDATIAVLNRNIGDAVRVIVDLGLSVKHSKEKCTELIEHVESVHGSVDRVERDRQLNGLSPVFSEKNYEKSFERFSETLKDCKACLERYSQKRWIVRRIFQSLKYEEEFDSLIQRLNITRDFFQFDMQVDQTFYVHSTNVQQKEDTQTLQDILRHVKRIGEGVSAIKGDQVALDDNLVSEKYVLQIGESLAGDYFLAGKLDDKLDVMLVLTTSKDLPKETSILKLLSDNDDIDTNILRFYGTHALGEKVYLVMERPGQELITLRDWNMNETHGNDWRLKRKVVQEIAEGLAYAHIAGVVHKNLSSSSVYLTDDGRPKIYGFFKGRVKANPSDKMPIEAVQHRYTAPELLVRKRPDSNEKSDIFSLGVIIWELITCDVPFKELDTHMKLINGRTKHHVRLDFRGFESSVPFQVDFQQISLDCMKDNPEDRPTIDSIVSRLTRLAPEEMYVMSGAVSGASTSNS